MARCEMGAQHSIRRPPRRTISTWCRTTSACAGSQVAMRSSSRVSTPTFRTVAARRDSTLRRAASLTGRPWNSHRLIIGGAMVLSQYPVGGSSVISFSSPWGREPTSWRWPLMTASSHHGVGTLLMAAAVASARLRGVRRIVAWIKPENGAMQLLLTSSRHPLRLCWEGSVARCELDVPRDLSGRGGGIAAGPGASQPLATPRPQASGPRSGASNGHAAGSHRSGPTAWKWLFLSG